MELKIRRLNYMSKTPRGGFPVLPFMESFEMVPNINEISRIEISFENENDCIEFLKKFPKSYNGKKCKVWQPDGSIKWDVQFTFNTFFMNDSTGKENERALYLRGKVIEKLKVYFK